MADAAPNSSLLQPIGEERRVLLANPRGFCAGVERAISVVEAALDRFGPPVFVRRAIVHNREVVERLERRGAIFVAEIGEVPEGAIAILSAHGSARSVKVAGQARNLRLVDAICPLVAKVHAEVENWYRAGRHILLIGHQGHPEIVGTIGQVPAGAISVVASPADLEVLDLAANSAVAYAVQTTFATHDAEEMIAAIKARFADCVGPRTSDICYATTNRQRAVEAMAAQCDVVIVAGDVTSSNAQRLVEVARAAGCPEAFLVAVAAEVPFERIAKATTIGLTAAASTPDWIVEAISTSLRSRGYSLVEVPGVQETTRFKPVSLETIDRASFPTALSDRIEVVRRDVDAVLGAAIGTSTTRSRRLAEAMRYACLGGGKRFRTLLVVAVADLIGGSYAQALRIGAAIECVHAQSLIHDDLPCMDNDDLRRGRPTLHRKFDEATALLAGDALLALAFEILADPLSHPDGATRAELVLALTRAVGQDGLAGGQMMDLYPPAEPTAADLFACEARKTGALIRYAVQAATMLGPCSADEQDRLLQFAENLGLVFQIRDDILDRIGDPAAVGKGLRKDESSGRKSATVIMGLTGAEQEASRLKNACHEALAVFGSKASPLRDLAKFAVERVH
ncbi:4-hydroxy-3-methylbut-2-enyl diphosphate reductase [Novosphingobium sp. PS1R-30]|uniref:4-hydroxy-3-methylbut-2-enyl diphosphate reductase n=1 Tax=Novosphingobium anseongense TaxID=3133436 RepID=A0ABU8S3V3_9SPHN